MQARTTRLRRQMRPPGDARRVGSPSGLEGRQIIQPPHTEIFSRRHPVVAVTSLALEARIARGRSVVVICDYGSHLVYSLRAAVSRGAAGIISFGVAAGLARELAPGDCVIASGVRTQEAYFPADRVWASRLVAALPGSVHADIAGTDTLLVHPAQKRALHECSRAVVADMESHIAARLAAEQRVPFAAVRVVIDPVEETLPPAAEVGLREDGSPDVPAVLKSLARRPTQLPALVRTACCASVAKKALRQVRAALGDALGSPYFGGVAAAPVECNFVGGLLVRGLRR
jgi:adenosylhomocysteine nucleosidase